MNASSLRNDSVGDLWERFTGGAIELIVCALEDYTLVMRLYVTASSRRPAVGTVELSERGRNVLAAQALVGHADLLCSAG